MDGNAVLGCVVCAVVGGLVLVLAVWQMRTGSVRFLHSYHYVNVPAADRPALALESGRWLAATGACVVLLGFSLLLPSPVADAFAIALVIALFAAIIMTCRVIVSREADWLHHQGEPRQVPHYPRWRSEERRVGKECRSRWSPYH